MDTEVKEVIDNVKPNVQVRFALPTPVHRGAMGIHAQNPRSWTFEDTMTDIVREGVKAIRQRNKKNN